MLFTLEPLMTDLFYLYNNVKSSLLVPRILHIKVQQAAKKKKKKKNLAAMQETQVQFLGLEDSLEKEMATPSSVLAWRIPWTEEPGRL